MDEYLYRYIPFETFVGMIQNKSLTFVLPELWEDPKECLCFNHYVEQQEDINVKLMLWSVYYKTFCQCWTTLAESDAMWRIYSYNNRAVRISIKRESVGLLDNVKTIDVKYTDNLDSTFEQGESGYLKTLSQKRIAFQHEKEVRLIKHYKFSGTDDYQQHIYAWYAISENPKSLEIAEKMFPEKSLEEKVKSISKLLNIGKYAKQTLDVSFSHIPRFIEGVLVHPIAPEWYVDIVREFCRRNHILFEGKSTLYSK